jgi:hypothetical protein
MVQQVNEKEGAVADIRYYPDIHFERQRKTMITWQKVLVIC